MSAARSLLFGSRMLACISQGVLCCWSARCCAVYPPERPVLLAVVSSANYAQINPVQPGANGSGSFPRTRLANCETERTSAQVNEFMPALRCQAPELLRPRAHAHSRAQRRRRGILSFVLRICRDPLLLVLVNSPLHLVAAACEANARLHVQQPRRPCPQEDMSRYRYPDDVEKKNRGFLGHDSAVLPPRERQARNQLRYELDLNSWNLRIWGVAASGFLTDSYNLFASNVISTSISFVYFPSDRLPSLVINLVTLLGSVVGQLLFGYLADRYGRTRLYGIELVLVIVSTIGLATCSAGYNDMSFLGLFAWVSSSNVVVPCCRVPTRSKSVSSDLLPCSGVL